MTAEPVNPATPPAAPAMKVTRRRYDPRPPRNNGTGNGPPPGIEDPLRTTPAGRGLPYMAAVASRVEEQNPGRRFVWMAARNGPKPGDEGKVPITNEWQKTGNGLLLDDRRWNNNVTGYGPVLTDNDWLLIIDIDNEQSLNPQASALLAALNPLTYKTGKGRHHLVAVPPGRYEPMTTGGPYDRIYGEVFYNAKRFVAFTGSANKKFPEQGNYVIPEADTAILDLLLAELQAHPPKPIPARNANPSGTGGGIHNRQMAFIQQNLDKHPGLTDEELIEQLKTTEDFQTAVAQAGYNQVIQKVKKSAAGWRNKTRNRHLQDDEEANYRPDNEPPPEAYYQEEPPAAAESYRGPGLIRLGDLTIAGQEIIVDDIVIGWLQGPPVDYGRFPIKDKQLYQRYRDFYIRHMRIPVPTPIQIFNLQDLENYERTIPEPYRINTPSGGGNIIIPAKEWTLLVAKKKQGKTWAAMTIAAELSVPSIYIATEGLTAIKDRIRLIGQSRFDNKVLFHNRPNAARMRNLAEQADIINAEIIFIDVLAPFLEDEIKASSFNDFERFMLPLTEGRTVILVHHYGQDQGKGARGTSRIEDAVGYGYRISRDTPPDGNYTRIVIRPDDDLDRLGLKSAGAELRLGPERDRFVAALHPIQAVSVRGNTAEIAAAWQAAAGKTQTTLEGVKKFPTETAMVAELHVIAGGSENGAKKRIKGAIQDGMFRIIPGGGATGAPGYELLN